MNIALDFDETYTLDPEFWERFIDNAFECNHEVFIVTSRDEVLDWDNRFRVFHDGPIQVVWCDGKPKRGVCESLGIKIDVWIDDMPEVITKGSSYTPEQLAEWRTKNKEAAKQG